MLVDWALGRACRDRCRKSKFASGAARGRGPEAEILVVGGEMGHNRKCSASRQAIALHLRLCKAQIAWSNHKNILETPFLNNRSINVAESLKEPDSCLSDSRLLRSRSRALV